MQPHVGQRIESVGPPLGEGSAAMILVHGRGATPENILDLAAQLTHPAFTYLAPAAAGNTWYPLSFMADIAANEPGISSGLGVLDGLVRTVMEAGLSREHIVLAGFSQGACLTHHLSIELDFFAHLLEIGRVRSAHAFLVNHLLFWMPGWVRGLSREPSWRFYPLVGRTLLECLRVLGLLLPVR